MSWGHRLKRLTKREIAECRTLGWGCGACDGTVAYVSDYCYASADGHAAQARRTLCAEHARVFAARLRLQAAGAEGAASPALS